MLAINNFFAGFMRIYLRIRLFSYIKALIVILVAVEHINCTQFLGQRFLKSVFSIRSNFTFLFTPVILNNSDIWYLCYCKTSSGLFPVVLVFDGNIFYAHSYSFYIIYK